MVGDVLESAPLTAYPFLTSKPFNQKVLLLLVLYIIL